jgi:hypothetical protein
MARTISLLAAFMLALLVTPGASAVDFLRGDANSDGNVSVSDAHFISRFLFEGGARADCMKAMDVNGDGTINVTDSVFIENYEWLGGPPPALPFPEPGPGEAGGEGASVPCDSYEVEPPLEDPGATIQILDVVAPGGQEGHAVITILLTSSRPLGGYTGRILVDTAVVAMVYPETKDLTGISDAIGMSGANLEGGTIEFGCLASIRSKQPIPPGEDVSVLEIMACLRDGAQPGEYPLTLQSAELADDATARAIFPARVSGTLTVLEQVAEGAGCTRSCVAEPTPKPLPPIDAQYRIQGGTARPGEEVRLPFFILCTAEVQGYSLCVDFDEEVLEGTSVDEVYETPAGTPYDFSVYEFNNKNDNPGSAGVDEGFLVGAAVFSFRSSCANMPANREEPALAFHFRVKPDTQVASTEVRFLDGGNRDGGPGMINSITAFGASIDPGTASNFIFINGLVDVLPEISIFVRGDSNGDKAVDISDAQHTLGYLFLGSLRPWCFDAADANDDGTLNIVDPIYMLNHLFLGGPLLPQPYPDEGTDATEDGMSCSLE